MKKTLLALAAVLGTLWLAGCTVRPYALPAESAQSAAAEAAAPAEAEAAQSYTVRYLLDGQELGAETVPAGALPAGIAEPDCGGLTFLGWLDASGAEADPAAVPVTADTSYTARTAPALHSDRAFLTAPHAIFRPEAALTRVECAELLFALLPETPEIPAELPSEPVYDADIIPDGALSRRGEKEDAADAGAVEAAAAVVEFDASLQGGEPTEAAPVTVSGYSELAALCAAGMLSDAGDGSLHPADAAALSELTAILSDYYPAARLTEALEGITGETITRADTALLFTRLTGRVSTQSACFADVEPSDDRLGAMLAAAECPEAEEGNWLTPSGALYHVQADGTVLRDGDVGTMHFGADGVFTFGDETLDALVRPMVAAVVDLDADRETQLRAVYNYLRDHFQYYRRNYYDIGEHGWETEEAAFLLSKHMGNCYSFAAGLWAVARGIGYDAHCIAGMVGENPTQHGWIWIEHEDGVRYFYDVELEYAALRDGATLYPMYKLPWSSSTLNWDYIYNWGIEGFH